MNVPIKFSTDLIRGMQSVWLNLDLVVEGVGLQPSNSYHSHSLGAEDWTTKLSPTHRLSNINIQTVTDKEMFFFCYKNSIIFCVSAGIVRQSIRSGFWKILGITKTAFNDIRSISGSQWWTNFQDPHWFHGLCIIVARTFFIVCHNEQ